MHYSSPLVILAIAGLLNACGANPNLLVFTTPGAQKATFDQELAMARANYDASRLDEAQVHGEAAYKLNPYSELAAVTLAYIYLGQAGMTPFGLAKKLMAQGLANKETGKAQNSSEILSDLGDVVGLTEDEFTMLGTLNTDDPDLPVIVPLCAGEARSNVARLALVNKAIAIACPFVDPAVRIAGDLRHDCELKGTSGAHTKKANFLWAFAHLVEAIAFHAVMTYTTVGDGTETNLEQRVNKINKIEIDNPANLTTFIAAVASLNATITKVIPTDPICSEENPQSELDALVTDMISVNLAFSTLPGIPPAMTASISKAVEGITNLKAKTKTVDANKGQSNAAKGDITKKIAASIGDKIAKADTSKITPAQTEQVCALYTQISGGVATNVPPLCQGQVQSQ